MVELHVHSVVHVCWISLSLFFFSPLGKRKRKHALIHVQSAMYAWQ